MYFGSTCPDRTVVALASSDARIKLILITFDPDFAQFPFRFFPLLLMYLIVGVLINRFGRGIQSMPELIPNHSFWADFPFLVKVNIRVHYILVFGVSDNVYVKTRVYFLMHGIMTRGNNLSVKSNYIIVVIIIFIVIINNHNNNSNRNITRTKFP